MEVLAVGQYGCALAYSVLREYVVISIAPVCPTDAQPQKSKLSPPKTVCTTPATRVGDEIHTLNWMSQSQTLRLDRFHPIKTEDWTRPRPK